MRCPSVWVGCLWSCLAAVACGGGETAGVGSPVGAGGGGGGGAGGGAGAGGASGSGTFVTPTAQQLQDFAAGWEAAMCNALAACCQEAGLATGGTCFFDGFWDETWGADPARVTFDAEQAAQCLTALEAALVESCSTRAPSAIGERCGRVFQGLVPPGGACAVSIECARAPGEAAFCEPSGPPPALGTCHVEAIPAAPPTCEAACRGGGSAGAPGDCACAESAYCEAASSTCQPKKAVGEPCGGGLDECVDRCDDATGLCVGMASAMTCAGRP